MYKNGKTSERGPIGRDLVNMLDSLAHRGRDSTGFTIVGESFSGDFLIRMFTENKSQSNATFGITEEKIGNLGARITSKQVWDQFLRITVTYNGNSRKLAEALLDIPGIDLHSIGKVSEVIKDIGTATSLDNLYNIQDMLGTHGIGHVRMATESVVDINHAHPFWAFPFPDITVVHNGQLTNYYNLKRKYEDAGHRFQTGNDSELIAVYLAEKLSKGQNLEDALNKTISLADERAMSQKNNPYASLNSLCEYISKILNW